jgi:DNA polymerase-1
LVQVPDYKALVGDSSDNLPGVAGIGPKTAAGLLQAWGSAEGVFAPQAMQAHSAGVQKKLQGQQQAAAVYKDLTILRCAVLGQDASARVGLLGVLGVAALQVN